MGVGVGPMGRVYVFDVVPLTLQAAALAALQQLAAAGNLVLTAGAGVTTSVGQDGTTRYILDTPRTVSLASTGDLSLITFTVRGFDVYGQPMTQIMAGPIANTVNTLKAFKSVVSISASAAVATDVSAGYGNTLGLPVRVTHGSYIVSARMGLPGTIADDAGTLVAAVVADPSTALLGDVRGTYTPATAPNGVRRLVIVIAIPAIGSGPNATRVGALGVNQV